MAIAQQNLAQVVAQTVQETPLLDIHTHLYHPSYDGLLLWGPDELVTYHYLIAETYRYIDLPFAEYFAMDKKDQADLIWDTLFVQRSPVSEACRGVLTAFAKLGIRVSRDLNDIRRQFGEYTPEGYVNEVFGIANVRQAVMTNDPFDDKERAQWLAGKPQHDKLQAALRLDQLLLNWPTAVPRLQEWGYGVRLDMDAQVMAEVRRFLTDWIERMGAVYMAVSLPYTFQYPDASPVTRLIEEAILPVGLAKDLPLALMIGVARQINPTLSLAGDGVQPSDVSAVINLCAKYPKNKFMVTMLSENDQHTLVVAARKFRNLLVFGCWWFLNNPSIIERMTRMRMELLGLSFIPQHSDARVLDQLLYKWSHSRQIIARVLTDKYQDLMATGWEVSETDIQADVLALLGGVFDTFIQLKL